MNLAVVAVRLFPVLSASESRLSAFLGKQLQHVDMPTPQAVPHGFYQMERKTLSFRAEI